MSDLGIYVFWPMLWIDMSGIVWLPPVLLFLLHRSIRSRVRFFLTCVLSLLGAEVLFFALGILSTSLNIVSSTSDSFMSAFVGLIFLVVVLAYIPIVAVSIVAIRKRRPTWMGFAHAGT